MFDAAGDVEIAVPVGDGAAGVDDGVHSRGAEPVDGFAGDCDWKSGEEKSHAGDVAIVFAGLIGAAQDNVSDLVGGNFRVSPHELGDGVRGEVVGANRGERSAE